MKIIQIDDNTQLVADNIAYLNKYTLLDGTSGYAAITTDNTNFNLTEEQYNEIIEYLSK